MTGRIASMSIDGTPISAADRARMAADEALQAEWRKRAVRVVAGAAQGVDDCRLLLDILGLDAAAVMDAQPKPAGEPMTQAPAASTAADGKRSGKASARRRQRAA